MNRSDDDSQMDSDCEKPDDPVNVTFKVQVNRRGRWMDAHVTCRLSDIRAYYISEPNPLHPAFVESCDEKELIRMAQLASNPFVDFLDERQEMRNAA